MRTIARSDAVALTYFAITIEEDNAITKAARAIAASVGTMTMMQAATATRRKHTQLQREKDRRVHEKMRSREKKKIRRLREMKENRRSSTENLAYSVSAKRVHSTITNYPARKCSE